MEATVTLNRLFHNSSEQFKKKQCTLRVSKQSRKSINYEGMAKMIKEIVTIFDECGVTAHKNQFIGIIADEVYIEIIAALVAIMDTENAFVFLDASFPLTTNVIKQLKVTWLIGEHSCTESWRRRSPSSSVNLRKTFKVFENDFSVWKHTSQYENHSNEYKFAFAMMSSGSTGDPKIIKVLHESVVPNIIDLREIYHLKPEDVLYSSTTLTFDPSIVDIFLAFCSGASILLPSNETKFDSNFLLKIFTGGDDHVTVWYTTPSLFVKCAPKRIECSSLKILILGGEQFPNLDLESRPFLKNVKVYNIYGITEVSCWASVQLVEDFSKPVPLGKVLSDTVFEIKNENQADHVGELYIGSRHRKCVVDDDFSALSDDMVFRATGDFVKVIKGDYYYVGRKYRRIKLYGHIVDLSVVEGTILRHQHVKCCCCIFIEEENKIIAFVEPEQESLDPSSLEKFLKAQLPPAMLPSNIYVQKIPINKHGKICERSCRKLYTEMQASVNDIYKEFRNLWRKFTLIDTTDDTLGFVDSGGNSILALQFATVLSDLCKVPTDFIAFLLSNENFTKCFELIEKELSDTEEQSGEKFSSHNFKRVTNGEVIQKSKKMKASHLGKVLQVKGKNYAENRHRESIDQDGNLRTKELKISWKHDLEKCVDASPTLVVFKNTSVVICGSHSGQLIMADVRSGDIILKIRLPDRIESSAAISNCGEYLFIGCYDKKLYCINIAENCILWHYETDGIVKNSPVLQDDKVYFGSYDHNFYCISAETGGLIWKTNIDKSSIYATPIVGQRIIVVTLGGTVAVLNHDGDIIYSILCGKPFFSNPVELPIGEEFIVIDVTGVLRLINISTGCEIWNHRIGGNVFSSISLVDSCRNRIVFGCHDKNIYCFDISNEVPKLVWKKKLDDAIYSTPFAFGNRSSSDVNSYNYRCIVATSTSGNIYIIDSDDGNCLLNRSNSGPIFSSPVVHDSRIVVGCRDNFLYCFMMA